MNYYPMYNNPYYSPYGQPQNQRVPQMEQQFSQPQQFFKQVNSLQGKSVDSVEVVKAMDIPLDGSISYFPLTDGSAIISKQLQMDGTSKTIIYQPVKEQKEENKITYSIPEELNTQIQNISAENTSLKESITYLTEQIDALSNNFKDFMKELSKGGKKQ